MMFFGNYLFPILGIFFLLSSTYATYQIGIGRGDATGPAGGIVFMGYAKSGQVGCGLHLRQWSRAFIVDDGKTRVAFVTTDSCMMTHGIKEEVLKRLQKIFNNTYTYDNLILSGTHTHSTPGGFMMDLMYDVPDFGFVEDTFMALATGITEAVVNAHNNIVEGEIYVTAGEVIDANINRSPASYLRNPQEERDKYQYNTDKDLVQLRFVRSQDKELIGAIHWYAVHPTSMNNTNCLITSDNVGYASLLLEQSINKGNLPGDGDFVGAFASTNLGDVSPNLKGPKCVNTGEDCDFETSTCNGEAKYCIAFGPGDDMVESTHIIAHRLFNKAQELLSADNATEVTGPVKFIHQFVEMPKQNATITLANGTEQTVYGCLPAMGYGFAAGTTDGPGDFDFTQATTTTNPFWNLVRDFAFPPTPEEVACQYPKPILINTGGISFPYQWQTHIIASQLIMIGNVVLTAVPGEFTTMSGRRLREAVKNAVVSNGGPENTRVIITGLSNFYTSYIATPEEYTLQRYEGASTIYGPHTLTIYLKIYENLAAALMKGQSIDAGPLPVDFSDQLITLALPVLYDNPKFGFNYGDCLVQPPTVAHINDTVLVKFVSGHPRNNVMHRKTFLTVEKQNSDSNWTVIATDASWETRFIWRKTALLQGTSEATISWEIGPDVEPGTYRIRHFGNYKYILGGAIKPYEGMTNSFEVQ